MDCKIIFLGIAGNDSPYQQLISAGGIILKLEDKQFHIDPGPGALISYKEANVNPKETNVIFATHSHLNHFNDVNAIINTISFPGADKVGSLILSKSLSEERFLRDCLKEVSSLSPNQEKYFGSIKVKTLPAKHSDEHTIGLRFTTPNLTITYSSDTGYSKKIIEAYKNTDILILNNVFPLNHEKSKNNLNTLDSIKIINQIKPSLAIITHFSTKMLEANPLYEAREIQKQTEVQTIAAKDGLIINPLSKSISLRQKSLNQY